MAKTWGVRFKFERGGSGKGSGFTNTLYVNTDAPLAGDFLGLDPMFDAVNALATALRGALVSSATIVQATVFDPLRKGQGYDHRYMRTIALNLAGQKAEGASTPEIKEVVIRLQKRGGTGRAGRLELRMYALEGEVIAGSTGDPTAPGIPAGIAGMITALNAYNDNDREIRVWSRTKNGVIRDTKVDDFVYRGVGTRDTRIHRKKKRNVTNERSFGEAVAQTARELLVTMAEATIHRAAISSPAGLALYALMQAARPAIEALPQAAENLMLALPGGE
jgi:hypothetical protein